MFKILLLLSALILTTSGCSHYGPVQMGSGESGGKQITSCNHNILTFPTDAEAERLDVNLLKNGLKSNDIFTVERKVWPYLWPVYWNSCVVLSLNKTGYERFKLAREKKVQAMQEVTVAPAKSNATGATSSEEDLKNFTHVQNVEQCEELYGRMLMLKGRCRKAIANRQ